MVDAGEQRKKQLWEDGGTGDAGGGRKREGWAPKAAQWRSTSLDMAFSRSEWQMVTATRSRRSLKRGTVTVSCTVHPATANQPAARQVRAGPTSKWRSAACCRHCRAVVTGARLAAHTRGTTQAR